jgi:hypothetical protein
MYFPYGEAICKIRESVKCPSKVTCARFDRDGVRIVIVFDLQEFHLEVSWVANSITNFRDEIALTFFHSLQDRTFSRTSVQVFSTEEVIKLINEAISQESSI